MWLLVLSRVIHEEREREAIRSAERSRLLQCGSRPVVPARLVERRPEAEVPASRPRHVDVAG